MDDFEEFDLGDDELLPEDDECYKEQQGDYVVYRTIRRRTARLTQLQRQYMLNYMIQHPSFAQARSNQTRNKDKMWKHLTSQINKLGPCKTIQQWKVIWKELKSRVRKKVKNFKNGENSANKIYLTEQEIKLNDILDGGSANLQQSNEVIENVDPTITEDSFETHEDINEEPSSTQQLPREVIKKEVYRGPLRVRRPIKLLRKAVLDGGFTTRDRKINEAIASSLKSIADSMKKRVEIEERRAKVEEENNKIMKKLMSVLPKMFETVVNNELNDVLE